MTTHESIIAILDDIAFRDEVIESKIADVKRLEAENANRVSTIYEQQVIIASLEEEIARLLNWIRGATLRSYVSHFPDCALRNPELDENGLRLSCSCDCGLDEILKGGEP